MNSRDRRLVNNSEGGKIRLRNATEWLSISWNWIDEWNDYLLDCHSFEKRGILMIRLHDNLHWYSSRNIYSTVWNSIGFDRSFRVASVLTIRSKFGIMEKSGKGGRRKWREVASKRRVTRRRRFLLVLLSENLKFPAIRPGRDILLSGPLSTERDPGNVLKCMACREKKGTNYHGTLEVIYDRWRSFDLSNSFNYLSDLLSDSIQTLSLVIRSIFRRSFFFSFRKIKEGKWRQFFIEHVSDSFEFFFSFVPSFFGIWRSFFSFRKIYFINFKKEFSGQKRHVW